MAGGGKTARRVRDVGRLATFPACWGLPYPANRLDSEPVGLIPLHADPRFSPIVDFFEILLQHFGFLRLESRQFGAEQDCLVFQLVVEGKLGSGIVEARDNQERDVMVQAARRIPVHGERFECSEA